MSNENPQNNCTNDFKQSMINLKDLLLKYKIGQQILNYYERENQLQENCRNKLCDIIINDIENKNAKYVFKYFILFLLIYFLICYIVLLIPFYCFIYIDKRFG